MKLIYESMALICNHGTPGTIPKQLIEQRATDLARNGDLPMATMESGGGRASECFTYNSFGLKNTLLLGAPMPFMHDPAPIWFISILAIYILRICQSYTGWAATGALGRETMELTMAWVCEMSCLSPSIVLTALGFPFCAPGVVVVAVDCSCVAFLCARCRVCHRRPLWRCFFCARGVVLVTVDRSGAP